mgnify:CR=1 FL=1
MKEKMLNISLPVQAEGHCVKPISRFVPPHLSLIFY